MTDTQQVLSETQRDFLVEMMNVGAGNAAGVFNQMLQCPVELRIPTVHIVPLQDAASVTGGDPALPVTCVRMGIVGDVSGMFFFVVPLERAAKLSGLLQEAAMGSKATSTDMSLSTLAETGNILAGTYSAAIQCFCGLNIYHTVPSVQNDMIQSLLDESLVAMVRQVSTIIVIENTFVVGTDEITTYLLMVPSTESVATFAASIDRARSMIMDEG